MNSMIAMIPMQAMASWQSLRRGVSHTPPHRNIIADISAGRCCTSAHAQRDPCASLAASARSDAALHRTTTARPS
jgi:hypothetical protein